MFNLINSRLSIAARLSLIAAIFLVPVGLLIYLFIRQSSGDISFAAREIAGTQYLTSVWPAFAKTGETTNASAGPFTGKAGYDKLFDTADSAAAFAGANDVSAKLAAGSTLIGAIADGSNLTLDPDLDSFYAMDAATVRLPGILMAAVTLGQAAAETPGTPARTIHIAYAVNQLEMSTRQAGASLDAAMKNNAAGDTARALEKETAALKAASEAVIAQGKALLDGRNAADLPGLQQALLQQVDIAWGTASTELARLLQARVDRLYYKMFVNLIVAAGFLIAAMALSAVIARGLSKRLATLLKVMDQLVANDPSAEVPYQTDRNETGRIAQTLMAFRQSVVERGKLQSEKALVEELAEERRRSAEERESAARKQTHIVQTIAGGLEHLAGGDLTVCLTETFPPEFERLRLDLNKAVEQLKQTMVTVSTSALTIYSNSQEVATSASDLSGRTENQAASLEETAAALDQITATVKKTAEGASRAHDVVMSAKSDAEQSDIIVRQATKAMMSIEGSAKKISEIIGVMDEIAFQTNLLALNAGVEAARAGDSGRGFAVVAQEVRALAQRSAQAAKEIKGLILDSSRHVEEGVALVEKTGTALGRIVARVADIDNAVQGIAASAAEQAAGLSQVNTAINQMGQLTQQNAAMVEQSTAASHSLSQETELLSSLIGRFKIGQQTIQKQAAVHKPPAIRRPASGHLPASIRHDRRKEPRPPVLKTVLGGSSSGNIPRDDNWKEF